MENKIKHILEKEYHYDFKSEFFTDPINVFMDEVIEATTKSLQLEISELKKKMEWVPVSERLPDDSLKDKNDEVYVCGLVFENGGLEPYRVYFDGFKFWYPFTGITCETIVYWLPIPEPPQK